MSNTAEFNWQERLSQAQRNVSESIQSRMVVIGQAAKDVVESSKGNRTSLDITEDPLYQRVVAADPQETFPVKTSLGISAQVDVVGEKQALVVDVKESSRLVGWDRYLTSINGSAYGNVERKASLFEEGIADLDRQIKGRRVAGVDNTRLIKERGDLQRGLAELRSTRPLELQDESTIRPFDQLTPKLIQAAKTRISEVSGKAMYAPRKDGFLGFDNAVKARKELAEQRAQREVTQLRLAKLMGEKPVSISAKQILGPDGKPLINRFRNELISTLEGRAAQMEATPAPEVRPVVTPESVVAEPVTVPFVEPVVEPEAKGTVILGEAAADYLAALDDAANAGNLRLMSRVQGRFTEAVDRGEISDEEWRSLNAEANWLAGKVRNRRPAAPAASAAARWTRMSSDPGSRTHEAAPASPVAVPTADNRGRGRWSFRNIAGTVRNGLRAILPGRGQGIARWL